LTAALKLERHQQFIENVDIIMICALAPSGDSEASAALMRTDPLVGADAES
jgi:hypothetical protein